MLILAFDTSTLIGTVGYVQLSNDGDENHILDFAKVVLPAKPGHAEKLLNRIEYVLHEGNKKIEDVDLVVFGKGPGTFTGLRIGLSTAKALSFAHNIPIVGVSTLEMTALCARVQGTVVSLIDARRGELYCGAYHVSQINGVVSSRSIFSQRVIKAKDLASLLNKHNIEKKVFFSGNGIEQYREILLPIGTFAPAISYAPDAYWMSIYGYKHYKENGADDSIFMQPVYLREPDAKLPAKPLV